MRQLLVGVFIMTFRDVLGIKYVKVGCLVQ